MSLIADKVVDCFLYVFSREKYNFRVIERKIAPYKDNYYRSVENELRKEMGDDTWPLFLHAQASDPKFLESVTLLYEAGFRSRKQPASLVRYIVHGLFVYSTKSKPEGMLAIIRSIDLVKDTGDSEP